MKFNSFHKISRAFFAACFTLCTYFTYGQITINIVSYPENALDTDIFLAGNMNGWNPSDSMFRVKERKDGSKFIKFDPTTEKIEFKFTLGDWSSVEVDESGLDIPNRTYDYTGIPTIIEVNIEAWKKAEEIIRTASENVYKLEAAFPISQLNRERTIWVYLPKDYATSTKRYPVFYMHDGQNLFDRTTSFSGEWNIDETLDSLSIGDTSDVIVVGIENGGEYRIEEYTPWPNETYGGGKGDSYIDFIVESLKPHIDSTLRTKSDRDHTTIMGSSLGGLISFYGILKYPEVFGNAGIFSPSFWYTDDIYTMADTSTKYPNTKLYFLGGALESDTLIEEMERMVSILKAKGYDDQDIKFKISPQGKHNESFWAREFAECYQWLTNSSTK